MRERTFIAAMFGLDIMLILAGGVMSFGYRSRGGIAEALLAIVFIGLIGSFAIYQLNVFVFDLAESATSSRDSALVAGAFAVAVAIGGLASI